MSITPVPHRVSPLIFTGPSLPRARARLVCAGEYHPPIARGDLPRLAGDVPRAIVIIDGQFEQRRAVSPKEILGALDAGHAVYGAASMGALRAVECERFGMRGIGEIFEAFRNGELTRDDEVACGYDADTDRAVTEPLVCLRRAIDRTLRDGLLDPDQAQTLITTVAAWPWRDRTIAAVAGAAGLDPAATAQLAAHLRSHADLKTRDAEAVLQTVAAGFVPPVVPEPADVDLPERTGPNPTLAPLHDLEHTPKNGPWDSTRTVPPERTAERLDGVRHLVGITRVADITGLDVIGVPNTVAIRPSRDLLCNSAYSGKGMRIIDAHVGGQMEALEVAVGHDDRLPMRTATFAGLEAEGVAATDPRRLIPLPGWAHRLTTLPIEWVMGTVLRTGREILVPADCAVFRRTRGNRPWKISSNGLASGNTMVEAIAHALAEVIERDAETHYRIATEYAALPGLLRIVAGPEVVPPPPDAPAPPVDFPLIRLDTLPEPLLALAQQIQAAGIDVALRAITSDIGVPTVLCAIHEATLDDRQHMLQYGCGTHPDVRIAVRRAMTEATQSRVTAIQGAREDMDAGAICPAEPPEAWFAPDDPGVHLHDLGSTANRNVRDDIADMLDALERAQLDPAIVVDLTNDAIGFPVVKVLVPGLELAFHTVDPDRVAFGWRARRYL